MVLAVGLLIFPLATAFTIAPVVRPGGAYSNRSYMPRRRAFATKLYALPDIGSMRVGEIRQELESYGISTKSFLEKKEMVAALEKSRAKGKTPVNGAPSSSTSTASNGGTSSASSSRSERLKEQMEKAKAMKVGDLKTELQARGISTKSFFEKSEFVKAYAEAVVDGVSSKTGGSAAADEPMDPDYRDVIMQKVSGGDPRLFRRAKLL
jgi:hypothetical protein